MKRTPMTRTKMTRRTRNTGPTPAVRDAVTARNGGTCLCCDARPGEQVHHRKPRGMGGTSDPAVNRPSNLVWICAGCHASIERHRTLAYAEGWLVPYAADPASVPLLMPSSMVMLFDDEHASLRTDPLIDPAEWAQP